MGCNPIKIETNNNQGASAKEGKLSSEQMTRSKTKQAGKIPAEQRASLADQRALSCHHRRY